MTDAMRTDIAYLRPPKCHAYRTSQGLEEPAGEKTLSHTLSSVDGLAGHDVRVGLRLRGRLINPRGCTDEGFWVDVHRLVTAVHAR